MKEILEHNDNWTLSKENGIFSVTPSGSASSNPQSVMSMLGQLERKVNVYIQKMVTQLSMISKGLLSIPTIPTSFMHKKILQFTILHQVSIK